MDYVDNSLQNIDAQCKYKFGWNNIRNNIDRNIKQHQYMGLDDFIERKSKILK